MAGECRAGKEVGQVREHVAILKRAYLELVLAGRKTVECRLARVACPPYGRAAAGEVVWLKESCGPVRGRAVVERVQFREGLTAEEVEAIEREYERFILGGEAFWREKQGSRYATLVWLKDVRSIPARWLKRRWGMQAWLILDGRGPEWRKEADIQPGGRRAAPRQAEKGPA